jgi:(1->4)-alpha-D-glucan 1-alpha-D-glucosylmutase
VLLAETDDATVRDAYLEFAMKFQQLTSPVAAKGVEDTAFYRSMRLAALNEVGGDPGRFGTSVAEFHEQNAQRAQHRPHTMLATATHDAKRGEDVRARLAVLSEMPEEWRRAIARWTRLTARHATTQAGERAPSPLAEYVFYQTVVGAWPNALLGDAFDPDIVRGFADRIVAYMIKSAREAKLRSSWTKPDEAYEAALERFVRGALDPQTGLRFLESMRDFVRSIAVASMTNGLAQTVLRVTSPGVPDTYQGTELWDFTLVDPDNRRPVDFAERDRALREVDDALVAQGRQVSAGANDGREALALELLGAWPDGRIKLYVLAALLRHRAAMRWSADAYMPLTAQGSRAAHVVAFARGEALIVVPRLPYTLARSGMPIGEVWNDTALQLPFDAAASYRDVLTGRIVDAAISPSGFAIALAEALAVLPVTVLEPNPP